MTKTVKNKTTGKPRKAKPYKRNTQAVEDAVTIPEPPTPTVPALTPLQNVGEFIGQGTADGSIIALAYVYFTADGMVQYGHAGMSGERLVATSAYMQHHVSTQIKRAADAKAEQQWRKDHSVTDELDPGRDDTFPETEGNA